MCSNRNNPEEFVTAKRIAPTRAATIHCKMYSPDPWANWGRGEIGPRRSLLCWKIERGPRFYSVSRVSNMNSLQLSTAAIALRCR